MILIFCRTSNEAYIEHIDYSEAMEKTPIEDLWPQKEKVSGNKRRQQGRDTEDDSDDCHCYGEYGKNLGIWLDNEANNQNKKSRVSEHINIGEINDRMLGCLNCVLQHVVLHLLSNKKYTAQKLLSLY